MLKSLPGICFSFCALLLSKNCNVLIADLSLRPEAQALLEKYTTTPRAIFQKTDVTSWPALDAAFKRCLSEFGGYDIICPGAGVYEPHFSNFWYPPGSPESKDTKDGDRYMTMDINVTHPIRMAQLALADFLHPPKDFKMKPADPSNPKRIVMISSIAGQTTGLMTPLYFASKWAISGFTRSLAALDAPLGIRVSAVAPGVVKTPLWTEHPEKLKMVDENAGDKWVTPDECAEAMMKCMVDDSVPGGSVLEIGAGYTRLVGQFNDPGPAGGQGMTVGNAKVLVEEVFGLLGKEDWGRS